MIHIVDDLLIKQANNAVEEANGTELTVMEDGVCAWACNGAVQFREFS